MKRLTKQSSRGWMVGFVAAVLVLSGCGNLTMLIEDEQGTGSQTEFSVVLSDITPDVQFGPNYSRDFPEMLSPSVLAPVEVVGMKWGPTYHQDDPALIENRVQLPVSTTVEQKWGPRYDLDDPALVTG